MTFLTEFVTASRSSRERVVLSISACLLSPCVQAEVQVLPGKTTSIASPNDHYCQPDPTYSEAQPFLLRFAECYATNQSSSLQLRAEVCCTGFDEKVTSEGKLFYDFEIKNLAGDRPDILTTKADFAVRWDGYLISAGLPEIVSGVELYAKIVDRETGTDASELAVIDKTDAILQFDPLGFLYDIALALITNRTIEVQLPTGVNPERASSLGPRPASISAPLRAGGHYRLEIGAKCTAEKIAAAAGLAFCDFSVWADGQIIVVGPVNITVAEQPPGAADLINIITSPMLMDDDPRDVKRK